MRGPAVLDNDGMPASQSPGVGDGRPPEDRDRQSPRRGRIWFGEKEKDYT